MFNKNITTPSVLKKIRVETVYGCSGLFVASSSSVELSSPVMFETLISPAVEDLKCQIFHCAVCFVFNSIVVYQIVSKLIWNGISNAIHEIKVTSWIQTKLWRFYTGPNKSFLKHFGGRRLPQIKSLYKVKVRYLHSYVFTPCQLLQIEFVFKHNTERKQNTTATVNTISATTELCLYWKENAVQSEAFRHLIKFGSPKLFSSFRAGILVITLRL